MMFTARLNNPLTEADWNKICDREFEKTEKITFTVPSGNEVVFVKSDIIDRLESLRSEYNAYHYDNNDYWRGIKYAINVLEGK